jgi:cytochrome c oxidase subunit 4
MTEEKELHETQHHVVSPKIYVAVFLSLLVFTGLTVGASYVEMGVFNPIAAIAIACIKMVLVVLFFMHVGYSTKLTMLTVGCGFFMFLVLIGMTMADYISRAWGQW